MGIVTHGHTFRGRKSGTYVSWTRMVDRCTNSAYAEFFRYGGRGIKVCERWLTFENFLADMGERPIGKTLDRYPNRDGNYEPGNVRWATATEQVRNRDCTKIEPHEPSQIRWLSSLGYHHREIARFFGLSQPMVSGIVRGAYWKESA